MTQEKDPNELPPIVLSAQAAMDADFDEMVPGGAQGGVVARYRRRVKAVAVIRARGNVRFLGKTVDTEEDEAV